MSDVDPAARVPTCPDWDAADLLWHLTGVQHFWGRIVGDRLTDIDDLEEAARPTSYADLLASFDEASALLVDALAETADEVAVWTWFTPDESVRFVRRRQAHEALIHRVDAELVAGRVTDLDPTLAADGVLEGLQVQYAFAPAWADVTWDGPTGRLATTDTGGQWRVQTGFWGGHSPDTGTTYERESLVRMVGPDPVGYDATDGDPSDAADSFLVRATAADLDCWLWSRPTRGEVEASGDLTALQAMVSAGLQ